ncbi:MAG: hypothetical protein H7335_05720 [Massilia sp.]|nr:hypothetical protein [Massilia sp.]
MQDKTNDRNVNTKEKVQGDGVKRMPHERDESPDGLDRAPRGVMKQAADDLAQGLVDTDLHGLRGIEQAVPAPGAPGQARPQKDGADGMRHQTPATPPKDKQP